MRSLTGQFRKFARAPALNLFVDGRRGRLACDGLTVLGHTPGERDATQRRPETQGKDAPSDHTSAYHVCFRATIDWAIALSTQHSYSAHHKDIVVPSLQLHALRLDQIIA